jgi:formiminotetrahydrofolate cyclodeaminase
LNAANIPCHVSEKSVKVMELAVKCAKDANLNAISDSLSGFALARASLTAAAANVRINVNSLGDRSAGEKMIKEIVGYEKQADKLEKEIHKVMKERGGI